MLCFTCFNKDANNFSDSSGMVSLSELFCQANKNLVQLCFMKKSQKQISDLKWNNNLKSFLRGKVL